MAFGRDRARLRRLNVPCSFSFEASMGITCRMGSSVTSTFGSWRVSARALGVAMSTRPAR